MTMPRRVKTLPLFARQRRSSGPDAMSGVAVKVGAAGHQKAEITRHRAIARDGLSVMIGVVDLDRIETGMRQRRNPRVDVGAPGMRERCQSARAMDLRNDVFGRRA